MNNIRQISVFVENKQGRLSAIIRILKDNGINIRAISIADTKDFGILRLIVSDPDLACEKLREQKCTVTITEVVAIEIQDELGMLSSVMDILAEDKVNVEYMYAFISREQDRAYLIMRVADNETAIAALRAQGCDLLDGESVYQL